MSRHEYYAILDECVSRIRRGESPEACLVDYPSQANDLAPELVITAELVQLPLLEPTPDAVADGYEKMMAALDSRETMTPPANLRALLGDLVSRFNQGQRGFATPALRAAAVVVALVFVIGGFVLTAAADTLPGDALYPVKRSWENARLTLTADDASREALRSEFAKRRREEVRAVQKLGRPAVVDFSGVIESLEADVWQIDGLDVAITDETQVNGVANVGQQATVRAQVENDGFLYALNVVVESPEPLPSTIGPPATAQPTMTPQPVDNTQVTRDQAEPSPTPTPEPTRPQPTSTRAAIDQANEEPTRTPAPSVDGEATDEVRPTNTPLTDSLATSAPRATETRASTEPRPTPTPTTPSPTPTSTRRTVDVAPPTPTPTSATDHTTDPYRTPTPTRDVDTGNWLNHPP